MCDIVVVVDWVEVVIVVGGGNFFCGVEFS